MKWAVFKGILQKVASLSGRRLLAEENSCRCSMKIYPTE